MSFLQGFFPRPVRRVMHPVHSTMGSVKRRATPKPIRKAHYGMHPIGTATMHARRHREVRRGLFPFGVSLSLIGPSEGR